MADDEPVLKFRSYKPKDKELKQAVQGNMVQLASAEEFLGGKDVAAVAQDESAAAIEAPLMSVQPRKINFDLKRDCEKRMQKLERSTQKAIYELYREGAAAKGEQPELRVPSGEQVEF
jgi:coiled-coil domain-containing protein 12